MGVVANPVPEHRFDGRILLKQVSDTKRYARKTTNERFSHLVWLNEKIKREWQTVARRGLPQDPTAAQVLVQIDDAYEMEEEVEGRLILQFKTYGTGSTPTTKEWPRDTKLSKMKIRASPGDDTRPLKLDDCSLKVVWRKGEEYEADVTCDSAFMSRWMGAIGKTMREKYHWVPRDTPLYLIMDNAGGHGTNDTIE